MSCDLGVITKVVPGILERLVAEPVGLFNVAVSEKFVGLLEQLVQCIFLHNL